MRVRWIWIDKEFGGGRGRGEGADRKGEQGVYAPWRISSAAMPMRWMPTTRSFWDLTQTSFMAVFVLRSVTAWYMLVKVDLYTCVAPPRIVSAPGSEGGVGRVRRVP